MRFTIMGEVVDGGIFGLRACKWLLKQPPEKKYANIVYGDDEWSVFVKRTKAGISARVVRLKR